MSEATYQYTHLYSKFDPQEGFVLNYEPKQFWNTLHRIKYLKLEESQ